MSKMSLIAGVVVLLVCAVGGMVLIQGRTAKDLREPILLVKHDVRRSLPAEKGIEPVANAPVAAAPADAPVRVADSKVQKPGAPAVTPKSQVWEAPAEPVVSEPAAREALSYVGKDPVAEAFWTKSINDPTLLPDQRRELIEDLNQDGFPDTKILTPDDLPMITNRIALIENLAPNAMDDTNAAAFQEAYKDLLKMYTKAGGQ